MPGKDVKHSNLPARGAHVFQAYELSNLKPEKVVTIVENHFFSVESLQRAGKFNPKPTDVVVVSAPRAGADLVSKICRLLTTAPRPPAFARAKLNAAVPWLESRYVDDDVESILTDDQGFGSPIRLFETHMSCLSLVPARRKGKFVYVVRHPVDLRISWFNYLRKVYTKNMKDSNIDGFTKFDSVFTADDFAYTDVTLTGTSGAAQTYEEDLVMWIKLIKRDNVKIIFYEDLLDRPEVVVKDLAEFVGATLTRAELFSVYEALMDNEGVYVKVVGDSRGISPETPKNKTPNRRKSFFVGGASSRRKSSVKSETSVKNDRRNTVGTGVAVYSYKARIHMDDMWEQVVGERLGIASYEAMYKQYSSSTKDYPFSQKAMRAAKKKAEAEAKAASGSGCLGFFFGGGGGGKRRVKMSASDGKDQLQLQKDSETTTARPRKASMGIHQALGALEEVDDELKALQKRQELFQKAESHRASQSGAGFGSSRKERKKQKQAEKRAAELEAQKLMFGVASTDELDKGDKTFKDYEGDRLESKMNKQKADLVADHEERRAVDVALEREVRGEAALHAERLSKDLALQEASRQAASSASDVPGDSGFRTGESQGSPSKQTSKRNSKLAPIIYFDGDPREPETEDLDFDELSLLDPRARPRDLLAKLLSDESVRSLFRTFLAKEHASEAYDFLSAALHWRDTFEESVGNRVRRAKEIVEKHLTEEAPDEVNIASEVSRMVRMSMKSKNVKEFLFDDAIKEVSVVLRSDNLKRFVFSDTFRESEFYSAEKRLKGASRRASTNRSASKKQQQQQKRALPDVELDNDMLDESSLEEKAVERPTVVAKSDAAVNRDGRSESVDAKFSASASKNELRENLNSIRMEKDIIDTVLTANDDREML